MTNFLIKKHVVSKAYKHIVYVVIIAIKVHELTTAIIVGHFDIFYVHILKAYSENIWKLL